MIFFLSAFPHNMPLSAYCPLLSNIQKAGKKNIIKNREN
jgi:hypothetical protein